MTIRIEAVKCWRGTMDKPNQYNAELSIQIGEDKKQFLVFDTILTREIAEKVSKQNEELIVNKIKEVIVESTKNFWPAKE